MDDRELFKNTAYYYAKYRAGYPTEFFEYVARYFGFNGKGRLLDLGCGTGQLTIPFAKYFEEVIGLDPEQEMLDEARKQVEKADIKNIKFMLRKAEEIADDLGTFRLTAMGASFHWMKQAEVLQKIYGLTEKKGGVVIAYGSSGSIGWNNENIEKWKKIRLHTVKKFLGEKRRAGNSFYKEPEKDFEDLLDESPFGGSEEWTYDYIRTWTLEEAINFLYSTSFASRRFFGDRLNEFEQELRTELLKLEPNGIFKEKVRLQALLVRK